MGGRGSGREGEWEGGGVGGRGSGREGQREGGGDRACERGARAGEREGGRDRTSEGEHTQLPIRPITKRVHFGCAAEHEIVIPPARHRADDRIRRQLHAHRSQVERPARPDPLPKQEQPVRREHERVTPPARDVGDLVAPEERHLPGLGLVLLGAVPARSPEPKGVQVPFVAQHHRKAEARGDAADPPPVERRYLHERIARRRGADPELPATVGPHGVEGALAHDEEMLAALSCATRTWAARRAIESSHRAVHRGAPPETC